MFPEFHIQREFRIPAMSICMHDLSRARAYATRCTSPVWSVLSQFRLVSGWGLMKWRSRRPMCPWGSGRSLLFIKDKN